MTQKFHSREIKTEVHSKTCTQMLMLTRTIFIIAQKWKQPKYHHAMSGQGNCDIPTQWVIIQQ